MAALSLILATALAAAAGDADAASDRATRGNAGGDVVRVAQAARAKAPAPGRQGARPANARARQRANARANGAGQSGAQAAGQANGTLPGETEGAQQLIDLIQESVAPETWDVRGGPGTMMYFAPKKVLVIRQTGDAHEQLQDLIRQLRR
ncbi:MAG: hypothetical protein AB7O59_25130 [Pirellulales bacterium]